MGHTDRPVQTDSFPNLELIPIEALGLPRRAHNILERQKINTLDQLLQLGEDGVAQIRQIGPLLLDAIFDSTAQYLGLPRESLTVPEVARNVKPTIPPAGESPSIVADFQQVLDYPIVVLTLSSRAKNMLKRAGVETIGELLEKRQQGFERIDLIGAKTAEDISLALDSFLNNPRLFTQGELDFLRDPRTNLITTDLGDGRPDLVGLIVPIVQKTFTALHYEREYEVFRRRYGLEESTRYTLQEIGDYFDITRERVRQIELRAIERVRNILLQDADRSLRVPQGLISEANSLRSLLASGAKLLTETEITAILHHRYPGSSSYKDLGAVRLLLDIFGFSEMPQSFAGAARTLRPSWLMSDDLDKPLLSEAVTAIHTVLVESVRPLSFFDLKVRINRPRKNKIDSDYLRFAAKIDEAIEVLPGDIFQVRFVELPSMADKAFRILCEAKEPMELRALQREITHRLIKAGEKTEASSANLRNQLAADQRFAAVGRSGIWSLAEWQSIRKDTILDLMKEFFHLEQKAATVDKVYEYVKAIRPEVSKQSVATYLASRADVFIKTSQSTYELAAWGSKPYQSSPRLKPSETSERLLVALRSIFSDGASQVKPLGQVIQDLSRQTGVPSSTIYSRLPQIPEIRLEPNPEHSRTKLVRYIGQEQSSSSTQKAETPTIRDSLLKAVVSYLANQPDRRAAMTDIAKHVAKLAGYNKSSFYRYLSESDVIEKRVIEGKAYCYLRADKQASTALSFPLVESISDPILKANVARAIGNFDIDNIDMGLFFLGKIFENELRAFLMEAQTAGAYPVSNKDLARLVSMIDWLEQNGIVTQKHHLTLLREQRNERAHGDIPNHLERERLLQYAPFLGDLYIKYIIIIREKRDGLPK